MKKLLLTPALLLALSSANAQLALTNFNSAGLPAGWSMIHDGKTISSAYSLVAPIVTGLSANAWIKWPVATGDSMMLTASLFDPAGTADRWLITPSFMVSSTDMVISWEDAQLLAKTGKSDIFEIYVSPSGGSAKADFTTKLGTSTLAGALSKRWLPIGAYNGTNIRIGFKNAGNDAGLMGMDNVQTEIKTAGTDGAADDFALSAYIMGTSGSATASLTITNKGTTTITSIKASYKVGSSAPVSQTFSSLSLIPGTSTTLNFTTPISGLAVGNYPVVGSIDEVNGAADMDATNNTKTKSLSIATKSVARSGLMEEFTSSTCVPCASFNSTFDPLIISLKANDPATKFNIVKYQMNWPSPGTDASYNPDGLARRTYYGVNSIPMHFTNGGEGGNGDAAEINDSKIPPAYMDITGTYVVKGDSIIADVTVTPYFTATGNFKLHMAATEYHYTNPGATTTQKEYYHVMRTMVNAGAGINITSMTAGTAQKFHWGAKYTKGSVAQGTNTFWASPFGGNLVAFVQDQSNQAVLQSQSIPATWPVSIAETNSVISQTSVYPNPATDHTSIAFKLESASNVGVNVVDALGRTVYTVAEQQLSAGTQVIVIPTNTLAAGTYLINLNTEKGSASQRFSVEK